MIVQSPEMRPFIETTDDETGYNERAWIRELLDTVDNGPPCDTPSVGGERWVGP